MPVSRTLEPGGKIAALSRWRFAQRHYTWTNLWKGAAVKWKAGLMVCVGAGVAKWELKSVLSEFQGYFKKKKE